MSNFNFPAFVSAENCEVYFNSQKLGLLQQVKISSVKDRYILLFKQVLSYEDLFSPDSFVNCVIEKYPIEEIILKVKSPQEPKVYSYKNCLPISHNINIQPGAFVVFTAVLEYKIIKNGENYGE